MTNCHVRIILSHFRPGYRCEILLPFFQIPILQCKNLFMSARTSWNTFIKKSGSAFHPYTFSNHKFPQIKSSPKSPPTSQPHNSPNPHLRLATTQRFSILVIFWLDTGQKQVFPLMVSQMWTNFLYEHSIRGPSTQLSVIFAFFVKRGNSKVETWENMKFKILDQICYTPVEMCNMQLQIRNIILLQYFLPTHRKYLRHKFSNRFHS